MKTSQPAGRQGFTLLELLIVIAIIGILISIGVVSYSSAQNKSRDARRRADMKAIQNAWEQYYADNNGAYPSSCSVSATYLPAGIPSDPQGAAYASNCTATTYYFCADVTGGENANSSGNYSASPKTHFCVSNLQ